MGGQPGFWDLDERYERLSAVGDPLEKLNSIKSWLGLSEQFRAFF